MRRVFGKSRILVVVAVTLLTLLPALTVAAAPPIHQATGGGTNALGAVENTIAFTALQTEVVSPPFPIAPPNAKGQFQLVARVLGGIDIHADVLYLAVNPAGTDAWLGLEVTKSNFAGIPVGAQRVIRVQDNGEGSKATAADRISLLQTAPAWVALTQPAYATQAWTNGNIQVK